MITNNGYTKARYSKNYPLENIVQIYCAINNPANDHR